MNKQHERADRVAVVRKTGRFLGRSHDDYESIAKISNLE